MSIINGYSNPIIKLFDPRRPEEPSHVLELPLTNSSGLTESYQLRKISHELIGLNAEEPLITTRQKILGYTITFTLNYNEYITGETLYTMVKTIFDASKAGWRVVLLPRADAPWREFDVLLANETLELGLNKGGIKAKAHRLPVLVFKTSGLEPDLKWFPPGTQQ
jgi:hypothetical protein